MGGDGREGGDGGDGGASGAGGDAGTLALDIALDTAPAGSAAGRGMELGLECTLRGGRVDAAQRLGAGHVQGLPAAAMLPQIPWTV